MSFIAVTPEKSPSWDKIQQLLETSFKAGDKIPGYPFDEGFPKITPVARKYELIFLDGQRVIATVDYSREYMSEGLQWRTSVSFDRNRVVAWREFIPGAKQGLTPFQTCIAQSLKAIVGDLQNMKKKN